MSHLGGLICCSILAQHALVLQLKYYMNAPSLSGTEQTLSKALLSRYDHLVWHLVSIWVACQFKSGLRVGFFFPLHHFFSFWIPIAMDKHVQHCVCLTGKMDIKVWMSLQLQLFHPYTL